MLCICQSFNFKSQTNSIKHVIYDLTLKTPDLVQSADYFYNNETRRQL